MKEHKIEIREVEKDLLGTENEKKVPKDSWQTAVGQK